MRPINIHCDSRKILFGSHSAVLRFYYLWLSVWSVGCLDGAWMLQPDWSKFSSTGRDVVFGHCSGTSGIGYLAIYNRRNENDSDEGAYELVVSCNGIHRTDCKKLTHGGFICPTCNMHLLQVGRH